MSLDASRPGLGVPALRTQIARVRNRAVRLTIARLLTAAAACAISAFSSLMCVPSVPSGFAAACSDVEVVFARGTFEPPGIGAVGQAFVDSLRAHLGEKSVEVYPVNYPASLDFSTAADGVIDASNKVRDLATKCPNTKLVMGGYSQGAAVIAYLTTDAIPAGFTLPPGITGPMPPSFANHVAVVALFGKPSNGFLNSIARAAPPITIGHLYSANTIDLCIPEDPICSADGYDTATHTLYAANGMVAQATDFTMRQLTSAGTTA